MRLLKFYLLSDQIKAHLDSYLGELTLFIVLLVISGIGFLLTFIQLIIVKPTSRKILIPIALITSLAFGVLIAIDFYLEYQLARYMAAHPPKVPDDGKPKKKGRGNSGFKTGYMIIYGNNTKKK